MKINNCEVSIDNLIHLNETALIKYHFNDIYLNEKQIDILNKYQINYKKYNGEKYIDGKYVDCISSADVLALLDFLYYGEGILEKVKEIDEKTKRELKSLLD